MEEDMEIDHIVDVPDTPDRVSARHDNRKYVGNPEKRRERFFPVADEMNDCRKYITVSSSEKSYPSKNAPIFRRAQTEKKFELGTTHSEGAENMDKGKTISCNFPFKSSHHGPAPVFDLTEENRQLHHGSKANATADKKELKSSIGNSSLSFVTDSSNTSRNSFAEKSKLDNKTFPGPGITLDRGKSISLSNDSQSPLKTEKQVALPPCFSSPPRGRGHKRLVRNGCISPHNIATRAKQSTENKQSGHQTKDIEQSHVGHSVSYSTISPISVDDIVAEDRGCGRAKGKEVLIHPSSQGLDTRTIHTASSSPAIRYEESNGAGNAIRNSHNYSGGLGGWRTTHSEKNDDQHLYDVNRHHSRNYDVGRFGYKESTNITDIRDIGNRQSSKDGPSSLIIPEVYRSTATRPTAETLTKRQRKRGSTSRNPNEASNSSEIMVLSSSVESSGSSMNQNPDLDPDLVELFSAPRYSNRHYEDLDDNDNNSSDARARQVEADEILARELQEQLYHDDSFEGRGIDEHLAWELQHAEGLFHTSIDSHDISNPTLLPRANRQPRSRSNQNPSNRRRNVPQVSLSNRMSQLRTRTRSRPPAPAMSSRGRRSRFPLDMDLEMRIDILEALEDAMGDFNDMGVVDEFFQAHRDFNEDDYEMLLALDESNHQHTGASANQINSLPQFTIQTDNFSEACAICLETPAKGETIRHLPCLHKFHKDCIDPWLRRKTSCPVCKSSVT